MGTRIRWVELVTHKVGVKFLTVLPRESLRARFVSGAIWSVVGVGLSQGLGFVAYVLTARFLGQRAFGELGMIQSTVGMFGIFAGLGLGLTATKHVAEFRSADPTRAGRIIGISMVAAVVTGGLVAAALALAAPQLAASALGASEFVVELRLGCLLLLFNAINGVQTGALSGFEAFRRVAWTSAIRGILNFVFLFGGVYFGGLRGAVIGLVLTAFSGLLINHVALQSEADACGMRITYRDFQPDELLILWKFSLPAFLSGAMVAPASWWVRAMLVHQPGGYAELGIFTAASRFQEVLAVAGETLGVAFLPILASKEAARSERFQRTNLLFSWILGIGPAVILIAFPEISTILFGRQYAGVEMSRTVVLALCFGCVLMYKQGLARILAASNLMWFGALSNGLWAAALLGGVYMLIGGGAPGIALAYLIAYILNTILILPIYTYYGLAPRKLIFSIETFVIWAVIAGLALLTLGGAGIGARAGGLLAAIVLLFVSLSRLTNSRAETLRPGLVAQ